MLTMLVGVLGIAILVFALSQGLIKSRWVSWGIGFAAGLPVAQYHGIHVFVFLAFARAVCTPPAQRVAKLARVVFLCVIFLLFSVPLGDLVVSINPAFQLAVMAATVCLLSAWLNRDDYLKMAMGLVFCCFCASVVAILQLAKIVPLDLFLLPTASQDRPASWYPEPDWLGLYAAVGVVMSFTIIRNQWFRIASVVVTVIALFVSGTRGAWIALLAVVGWGFVRNLVTRLRTTKSRSAVSFILFVGAIPALFIARSLFSAHFDEALARLEGVVGLGNGDSGVRARLGQLDGMLQLISSAPLTGHGLSASGRVGGFGAIDYGQGVVNTSGSNWLLSLLADGKLLAIPLILVLMYLALFGSRTYGGQPLLLLVLVSGLFSNPFFFPITWAAVVLAMAYFDRRRGSLKEVEAGDDSSADVSKRTLVSGRVASLNGFPLENGCS